MNDEQAAGKEFDEQTSVATSIYWLKAVIYQGGRVFEAASQATAHINSEVYNSRARMEELFFLTACHKAQRWIKHLKSTTVGGENPFAALSKDIKQVRNNREHDEERYGIGRNKDEDMARAKHNSPVTMDVSASVTVHHTHTSRILLGGIVDVAEVVSAAEAAIELLLKKQHAYWDKKIARFPDPVEQQVTIAQSYYIEGHF